ncbi:SPOR domain-containing protein [Granulosicoccus antarcticus]|uniref:Cell division protein FtsN n=1 Tax=Granulosicoccus antarcticus IMCC3135 TaxID=1192854 RepID=A0A2Z2NTH0_9GAMM|nr:SPOR domain-containing protein [Granulosicoccus antarcticus]ASJ70414.1 Cell division protein FtsN [Granulosicoccus antarcticus IMCC3135]
MVSGPQSEPHSNRLFVLALGLLVGFVIGFVVLLSRIPVGMSSSDITASQVSPNAVSNRFQFYSLLPEQTIAQEEKVEQKEKEAAVREVVPAAKVIPPATRVVPGSVQSLTARSLAAESYAEIPPANIGRESYFLQAGNYLNAEDAEKSRAALLLLGMEAFIVARGESNGTIGHRVRIGPFYDQARINSAKERLKRNGINYKLIRVTG